MRIINELKEFEKEQGMRKIPREMKKDITWWDEFMQSFHGISIMPPSSFASPDTVISSDSSLRGCGGWVHGRAFHTELPNWIKRTENIHINELELSAVMIAVKKWGNLIQNYNILAYCDNQTMVEVINRGVARNILAQKCLREICFILAQNNANIRMVYLMGVENRHSDFLLHWNDRKTRKKFAQLTQGMHVTFEPVHEDEFKFAHTW